MLKKALSVVLLMAVIPVASATAVLNGPLDILITNDDGFDTPGIRALHRSFSEAGHNVKIVAPSKNFSGSSASMTFNAIEVKEVEPDIYSVAGSPATTVVVGASAIFPADNQPDLVISGINEGANLGPAATMSGTVGATISAMNVLPTPIPAIAISTNVIGEDPHSQENLIMVDQISKFMVRLVETLRDKNSRLLPKGLALNVNYPPLPQEEIKGIQNSRQGQVPFFNIAFKKVAPDLYAPSFSLPEEAGKDVKRSDTVGFNEGYITIVPIDGDYTAGFFKRHKIATDIRDLTP
ncbi:5'/3'-nucleotidase SurE [Endozoicomonas arenosclerae]|uniref:5'/3'-nucleotidase SurE n=1 Tax=Endozoicomonas arenosclerae TaxID=1633495 RepID=UPI0007827320|nr:5'/3'-nucleotidase SurE [Endozoicomonas arenosclerae]